METVIRTNCGETKHSLYRITYNNGYIYVGSCSSTRDKGRRVGKNYFGSSAVALYYGWRKQNAAENIEYNKSQIALFEIWYYSDEDWDLSLESVFINDEAARIGIADCADILTKHKAWTSRYRLHGKLLNLQDNTMKSAQKAALEKFLKEGQTERQKAHSASLFQYQKFCCTKEARAKAVRSRRENNSEWYKDFVAKGQDVCHSKEAIEKANKTRIAKRAIYELSDGFVGDYVEVAEHLKVHKVVVAGWFRGKRTLPVRVGNISFKCIKK